MESGFGALPGLGQYRAPAGFMSFWYVLDLRNAGWRTGNPATSADKLLEGHQSDCSPTVWGSPCRPVVSPKRSARHQNRPMLSRQNGLLAHQHSSSTSMAIADPVRSGPFMKTSLGSFGTARTSLRETPNQRRPPQSRSEPSETFRTWPKNHHRPRSWKCA